MSKLRKIGEDAGDSWYYAKGTRSKKHGFKKPHNPRSGKSCSEKYPDGLRRKESSNG